MNTNLCNNTYLLSPPTAAAQEKYTSFQTLYIEYCMNTVHSNFHSSQTLYFPIIVLLFRISKNISLQHVKIYWEVSHENRLAYDCPWIVFCKMIKNVDNIIENYPETRPSKQCEFCIYLHDKSFNHSGLPEWFSWSGWSVGQVDLVVQIV